MTNQTQYPKHVALIPDGNRRWAKERELPTFEGHRRGFQAIRNLGRVIRKMGIQTFTVWAFSTENWKRSRDEVGYLMKIYEEWISQNLKEALRDQIRIVQLGRKDRLPQSLRLKLQDAEEKTSKFTKYYLAIALDYGGRDEIMRAISLGDRQKGQGRSLDEKSFEDLLDTKDLPQSNPDLIIRTSGEQRTSGFLLWQAAYAEYIFHPKYLPEFATKDFKDCIKEYQKRQRRFGK